MIRKLLRYVFNLRRTSVGPEELRLFPFDASLYHQVSLSLFYALLNFPFDACLYHQVTILVYMYNFEKLHIVC